MRPVRHCPTFRWISFFLFGVHHPVEGTWKRRPTPASCRPREIVGHGLPALRNSKKDIMNDGIPFAFFFSWNFYTNEFLDLKFGRIPFWFRPLPQILPAEPGKKMTHVVFEQGTVTREGTLYQPVLHIQPFPAPPPHSKYYKSCGTFINVQDPEDEPRNCPQPINNAQ